MNAFRHYLRRTVDYEVFPLAVDAAPFDVVLNLVSISPEQTAALVGVVADCGIRVGTTTADNRTPRGMSASSDSSSAATRRNSPAWRIESMPTTADLRRRSSAAAGSGGHTRGRRLRPLTR
ncbi:MAG: hypothetical protein M3O32_07885 [Actinomycetota bacterium]|nr:hypothetical protein [Actinomycetota bacterium]